MDALDGEAIGYVQLALDNTDDFTEITTQIEKKLAGKHDIYFIFSGENFELESWYFN